MAVRPAPGYVPKTYIMTKMLSKARPARNLYTRKSAREVDTAVSREERAPKMLVNTSTGIRPYLRHGWC